MDILTRRDFFIPSDANAYLGVLSNDRDINRGDLLSIVIEEYLAANLSPEDARTVNDKVSLANASDNALRGGRVLKMRYLAHRPRDGWRAHSWQMFGKSAWHRLCQIAQFGRVSPVDLAAAAIYWAVGIPEDSAPVADSKGHTVSPLPATPAIEMTEKPAGWTDFEWKMSQIMPG